LVNVYNALKLIATRIEINCNALYKSNYTLQSRTALHTAASLVVVACQVITSDTVA